MGFLVIDLLERRRAEALEARVRFLADRYRVRLLDDTERRVRIGEVNRTDIIVI